MSLLITTANSHCDRLCLVVAVGSRKTCPLPIAVQGSLYIETRWSICPTIAAFAGRPLMFRTAAIGLACNLGMQSIAERRDHTSTLEMLQTMGADHVQGFAIARPQLQVAIFASTAAADFITDL